MPSLMRPPSFCAPRLSALGCSPDREWCGHRPAGRDRGSIEAGVEQHVEIAEPRHEGAEALWVRWVGVLMQADRDPFGRECREIEVLAAERPREVDVGADLLADLQQQPRSA